MNRVIKHTGAKYPIIQAPMGWIARSQLASAVCNAGGLGVIETSSGEVDNCKAEIEKMSELTDQPFGVNLPLLFLKDDSMLEFCVQHGVNFVTTSAGDPSKYIDKLKNAGIIVYHAVPSVEGALKAANCGVDGLVVEGTEGGGFKSPEEVGLFVLIQAIRKQVDLPIIAAGGIADGAGMAAAFAVGAEGIQMGTRFVSSKESPVHENFKNYIFESPLNGTWILNKNSKPVIRALRTDFTKEILDAGEMDMTAMKKIQELYFEGNMNAAPALSGQSVGIIDSIKSAEDIINDTIKEFNETCSKLGGLKL
jgi:enoyl-[acyl-carrier protein] reductase II|tara:strand:+ start:832 stop:1755 length:924 start_codon:yes stop_codon:yes gene_type:complete